jgi:hypothetical protein
VLLSEANFMQAVPTKHHHDHHLLSAVPCEMHDHSDNEQAARLFTDQLNHVLRAALQRLAAERQSLLTGGTRRHSPAGQTNKRALQHPLGH